MGEPPGFKLFKLFNSRAQLNNLNNLNNLNPGGGPRRGGGVRDPPRELNNLNPGGSPVFKLFKLFNSRPRASPPRPPPPGFKLFKSRPQLNNLNMGEPPGFKLFNSRAQLNNLNNLNNLNPGGGPRGGGSGIPPGN